MRAYRDAIGRYFDVAGRTSRSGYWLFLLEAVVISLLAEGVDRWLALNALLPGLVALFHLVPIVTVQIRRLHDTGRSGWWALSLLALLGVLPLLMWSCLRGDPGTNRFGAPDGNDSRHDPGFRRGDLEPRITTDAQRLATLVEPRGPHPYLQPPEPSESWQIARLLLFMIGIGGGIYGMMVANGLHPFARFFTSPPSCSDPGVTALVSKLIKEGIAKTPLTAVVNLDKTIVTVGAIRTQGSSGTASECLAHIDVDYAFPAPIGAAEKAEVLQQLGGQWSSIDVRYRAELTDDAQQVYVTLKPQAE